MNFLAPLFLFGALAVIGPVIFHLIRRTTREKTPFSTLMFLQPTPPRITRRSRLENLWLLLLRCVVIALLATAFARPFFRQKSANAIAGPGKERTVILVDTSASLRRDGLWAESVKKAKAQISAATPEDEVALVAFDRSVRPLMTFEEWNQLLPSERSEIASQRLDTLSPTWFGTHLDAAMIRAAELLDAKSDAEPTARKMVIVSDLQEGAALNRLQGYEWPRGLSVSFITVGKPQPHNVSLQWIPEGDEAQVSAEPQPLRLRVSNSPGNNREQFTIRWTDTSAQSAEAGVARPKEPENKTADLPAYAPAGQSRIVRIPAKSSPTFTAVTIEGDDILFDNTVHLVPPQPVRIPILFLGRETAADSQGLLYYLHRAFPKTRSQSVEITAHGSEQSVPAFQAQAAQLVILGEAPNSSAIATARDAAKSGRIVLVALTSADSSAVLSELLERPAIPISEATIKDYALLGEIDFQHPFFAPFSDPRFSDFTKIHFWKHRRLDSAALGGARVIAKFDRGDPAVLQIPLGRGSIVVFASTWRPADSQLALSSKFVPLLHAMLEQSTSIPVSKAQYFVGDVIPLTAATGLSVKKPDGTEMAIATDPLSIEPEQPGIYTVSPGNQRIVVNLNPEESRVTPLPLDRFNALGVPLESAVLDPAAAAQRAATAQAVELEGRQKVWRWLIAGALGVLLIETLIAGKLSGAQRSSTIPTS